MTAARLATIGIVASALLAGCRSRTTASQPVRAPVEDEAPIDPYDAGPPPKYEPVVLPVQPSTPEPDGVLVDDICIVKDIAQYCAHREGGCPSFETAWGSKDDGKRSNNCGQAQPLLEMGRCGTGHYIRANGGFSGYIMYYDATGKLTVIDEWADYNAFCGGAMHIRYGPTPSCTPKPAHKKSCAEL